MMCPKDWEGGGMSVMGLLDVLFSFGSRFGLLSMYLGVLGWILPISLVSLSLSLSLSSSSSSSEEEEDEEDEEGKEVKMERRERNIQQVITKIYQQFHVPTLLYYPIVIFDKHTIDPLCKILMGLDVRLLERRNQE